MVPQARLDQGRLPVRGVHTTLAVAGRPSAFALMPESTDHIEHEGKHSTEQNGSCEWEVKGRVFSAVENVSRKTAHGKTGTSKEQEKGA